MMLFEAIDFETRAETLPTFFLTVFEGDLAGFCFWVDEADFEADFEAGFKFDLAVFGVDVPFFVAVAALDEDRVGMLEEEVVVCQRRTREKWAASASKFR